MVDWDVVERRRAKGWDWARIAEDPKASFHADPSAGDPGRALRSLYYQRRSKSKRRPGSVDGDGVGEDAEPERRWTLLRLAAILAPLFGVWFLLAYVLPSPVGAIVPAVPLLVILMLLAIALLAFALLRSAERWTATVRTSLAVGAVLGLVVAGLVGLTAVLSGCPTLAPATTSEPSHFQKANNPVWADNGAPVFFFYGSTACPFCSASSWAIEVALGAFGTLSGTHFDRSNPADSYPNTPEVILAGASYQSRWVSLRVAESTDSSHLTTPATNGCVESAYVGAYNAGDNFPFIVIGGQYFHVGTMVDPARLAGLTPAQVQGEVDNQSGSAWDAISPTAFLLEAFLLKVTGGQPPSVASNPAVASWLGQIH
jgi:hypothetical protein